MEKILSIIKENIKDDNKIFVFPTEIATDLWLDKYIIDVFENELPYPIAVAKERFLSWDKFKTSSIKSTRQDRDIIPSIIRKIFSINLIEKNKTLVESGQTPLFNEVISQKYVEFSQSFADWMTKVLPQLFLWKKKYFEKKKREEASPIENDYFTLYAEYEKFLDENNLYDSAWETPPFADEGKTYLIFYPESLSDFEEYKAILLSSSHIKLYDISTLTENMEEESVLERPSAYFFDNSAQELHHLMAFIKNAYENDQVPYENMAINLTDSEGFLPYLEREMEKYGIPYTTRIGKPIGNFLSGRLFDSILECFENRFSFDSVQRLLTNESLFWKRPDFNQSLINFGLKNNCFCAYENQWGKVESPFFQALENNEKYKTLFEYYVKLQNGIEKLCNAKTFTEVLTYYWEFKNRFLKDSQLLEEGETISEAQLETDAILGRCISELSNLISLEKDKNLFGLKVPSCFSFFVDYINDKEYLAKPKNRGVSIYPYRVAAAAPFQLHLIPNATQSQLSVVFPRLSFLPKDVKESLEITDTDISEVFIKMYSLNSELKPGFSASTYSYSGYSIIHSLLKEKKQEIVNPYGVYDAIEEEKKFWQKSSKAFLEGSEAHFMEKITSLQKKGFENWATNANSLLQPLTKIDSVTKSILSANHIKNGYLEVSPTLLKKFYDCPRFFVYEDLQKLYKEKEEAKLSSLDVGTILHNVLALFFQEYKDNSLPIPNFSDLPEGEKKIGSLLEKVIKDYHSNPINIKILESQRKEIQNLLVKFLKDFTTTYEDFYVVGTELSLSKELELGKEIEEELGAKVKIIGQIDLILLKDESIYIIDYKTRKTPSIKDCKIGPDGEEPSNFQLALYTMLYESTKENVKVDFAGFYSIEADKNPVIFGNSKCSREMFQETIDKVKEMVFSFAKSILKSSLSLETVKVRSECNSCVYKKICRGTYSVSGRNIYTGEER